MSPFPPGLEPVEDLNRSVWVQEALKDWPSGRRFIVRDLVPPVFEAYARILHRPLLLGDGREPNGTWGERAAELGRTLRAETSLRELEEKGSREDADDRWSLNEGSLSVPEASMLSSVLAAHTSDPSACWFAMWSGWGELSGGTVSLYPVGAPISELRMRWRTRLEGKRARREAARFRTFSLLGGGRSYLLFEGAVEDAARFDLGYGFQSPALWWPEDRAWFVHTEIDGSSTYLGGTHSMIDRLVGEQILESLHVQPGTPAAL